MVALIGLTHMVSSLVDYGIYMITIFEGKVETTANKLDGIKRNKESSFMAINKGQCKQFSWNYCYGFTHINTIKGKE